MAYIDKEYSIPVSFNYCESVNKMAFDGLNYYFTINNISKVLKTNKNLSIINTYDTCREYDCICYDFCEKCFWASSKGCSNKIFKLDCNMNELCSLKLSNCDNLGNLVGISYNCYNDSIILGFTCGICEFNKKSTCCTKLFSSSNLLIIDIISISPGYVLSTVKNQKNYIVVMNNNMNMIHCYEVPCNYTVKDMVFNPCSFTCKPTIDFLVYNSCNYCIDKIAVDNCILGFTPFKCNFLICSNSCNENNCDPYYPDDNRCPDFNPCPCPDDNCCPDFNPEDCRRSCSDVIESVALEQAALSHILNAEGEKIQKIVKCSDNVHDLLAVNKSVQETITNISRLETTLYDKLKLVLDIMDRCSNNCDCDCYRNNSYDCCNNNCDCYPDNSNCYHDNSNCYPDDGNSCNNSCDSPINDSEITNIFNDGDSCDNNCDCPINDSEITNIFNNDFNDFDDNDNC